MSDELIPPHDELSTPKTVPAEQPPMSTHRRLGRLVLVVVEGPDRGKQHQIELCRGRLVKAGRNVSNELVIHDELVSGTHFELLVQEQGICLRDLNSRNGVYIHGTRVSEALLEIGAVFRVGGTSIKIVSTATVSMPVSDRDHFGELYGDSPIMREAFADLERVAALAERLARPHHRRDRHRQGAGRPRPARRLSPRRRPLRRPGLHGTCRASWPSRTSWATPAGPSPAPSASYAGLFEQAHGGTLFIDELGELPLELQAKLLRPLERGEVVRLSDATVRKVNVRVIAATHRDLRLMMSQGRFREDLYYPARVQGRGDPGPARARRRTSCCSPAAS
jgi:predicted component of type VI protein secretion system